MKVTLSTPEFTSIKNHNLLTYFPHTSDNRITFIHAEKDNCLSYRSLSSDALTILYFLQEKGIRAGDEILFFVNDNEIFIKFFWACIFGGIIPVPVTLGYDEEHLLKVFNIWDYLQNPYILLDSKNLQKLDEFAVKFHLIHKMRFIKSKAIETDCISYKNKKGVPHDLKPGDIAFIQFSSGSTGNPKGVILTHDNLITNIHSILTGIKILSDDASLSWMPLTHDMGLIGFHIASLFGDIHQYIMPSLLFIRNPLLWLQKASEYKITLLSSPNFGYKHFLKKFRAKEETSLDLSSARLIFNGAEPISERVANKFLDVMGPFGLKRNVMFPVYGLAEASLAVSFPPVDEELRVITVSRLTLSPGEKISCCTENGASFVDLGYPLQNVQVRIVDNDTNLDEEYVGKIQIKGRNVTSGYYHNNEATRNAFSDDGWLDTGDLGFIKNGRLFVTGRVKDILFSNGINYYAHDIERLCEEIEEITTDKIACCGIFDDKEGRDVIILFIVFRKSFDQFSELAGRLKKLINKKISLYIDMVIPVKKIPKTTSGKTQRYKLIKKYLAGEYTDIIGEIEEIIREKQAATFKEIKDEVEKKVADVWRRILGLSQIGRTENFFELGGDSITIARLISELSGVFHINLTHSEFYENATITGIAGIIRGKEKGKNVQQYPLMAHSEANLYDPFPLTGVQMAYLMGRDEEFELGGISTHGYYEIETTLDISGLTSSLNKLIKKHPMLRAVITKDGTQKICRDVPEYTIRVVDIRTKSDSEKKEYILEERNRMSHQVFDEQTWPLFEFKALKISGEKSYLFIGIDLLIIDGASIQFLITDLMKYYKNSNAPLIPPCFSFRAYVLALNELKKTDLHRKDMEYWYAKIEDFPLPPALPLKRNPAEVAHPHFKRKIKIYTEKQNAELKRKAREFNVSISALLCTIYAKILSLWSNQPHIALNLTIFNRYPFHKDVQKLIGDFTSLIPLDILFNKADSFPDLIKDVQKRILEAFDHLHFDGIDFIRALSQHNKLGTKAVLPLVFTSMLVNYGEDAIHGLSSLGEIKNGISQTSQVYIDHQIMENNGCLWVSWDYVDEIFDNKVITSMFDQYILCINSLIGNKDPDKQFILPADEDFIACYNDSDEPIEPSTLQKLFILQAAKTPSAIAVKKQEEKLTFRELDEMSNRLAHHLLEKDITKGDFAGVYAHRNIRTMVNIMGILKSGAAYVPIDPDYPQERIEYMIANSNCKIILEPDYYTKNDISLCSPESLPDISCPEDIAYVIYTSGSTGRPKGVVITHGAVANTIIDINRKFSVNEKDKIIGLSSMCFDLSVYDIFGSFSTGATLVLINDIRDINHIIKILRQEQITIWNSVPAIMDLVTNQINEDSPEIDFWEAGNETEVQIPVTGYFNLRLVMLSGDWIPLPLPEKVKSLFSEAGIISLGGATEASIWSIYYPVDEIKPEWNSIPYGIPLANQKFYVLNYMQEHCPVSVEGELYIGGVGVALGYLNDKEKTNAAFIRHPSLGYIYKTGDYGVFREQGYIEFLGRRDFQVKIRGFRIELGEIESVLREHHAVKDVVLTAKKLVHNDNYLVAYIVSHAVASLEEMHEYFAKRDGFCRRKEPRLHYNTPCQLLFTSGNRIIGDIVDFSASCICVKASIAKIRKDDTITVLFKIPHSEKIEIKTTVLYITPERVVLSYVPDNGNIKKLKESIDLLESNQELIVFDNRKSELKLELDIQCIVKCPDCSQSCISDVLDISYSGLHLGNVAACFKAGDTVSLTLNSFNDELVTEGTIIWIKNNKSGIRFSADQKETLYNFIKSSISKSKNTFSALKEYALKKLPDYMVPSVFIQLDEIPLTHNGKVDRKALPEAEIIPKFHKIIKPKNEWENALLSIWKETLNKETISIHDNFFDLGGDSIKMVQIVNKITKKLKIEMNYRDFLHADTIAKLSTIIEKQEKKATIIEIKKAEPDKEHLHEPFPLTEVQFAYLMGRDATFEMGGGVYARVL